MNDTGICIAKFKSCDSVAILSRLASLWVVVLLLWPTRAPCSTTIAGLKVAADALDFGEVWEDSEFRWKLPIENTSSQRIEIVKLEASCGCVSVDPPSLLISPGQTRDVHLTLNLSPRNSERANFPVRELSFRLRPVIRSPLPRELTWILKGKVRNAFVELPESIDFGESCVRGGPFPVRTFQVIVPRAVKSLEADSSPSIAACKVIPPNMDSQVFSIELAPSKKLASGPFEFAVRLLATSDAGERLPAVTVPAFGRVVHDVFVDGPVVFGALSVGDTDKRKISVQSRTASKFAVGAIDYDAARMRVERDSHAPPDGTRFDVVLLRAERGAHRSIIRFHISQDRQPPYELEVPLVYHGFGSEGP